MINHARTLLLNLSGASRPGDGFYMEEFVDPDYVPIPLSAELTTIRNALFGQNPDRAWLNFRLRQFMAVLHSTEFEQVILDLDPRVTYRLDRPMPSLSTSATVNPLTVSATQTLHPIGTFAASLQVPRILRSWRIEVTGASEVTIRDTGPGGRTIVQNVTYPTAVSAPLSLPGITTGQLQIVGGGLVVGAKWDLQVFCAPAADLSQLEDLGTRPGGVPESVLYPPEEPYKTFFELRRDSLPMPYRASGLLLPFVLRLEEIRSHV